nr:immunoglobulin light chain junction region [Macaca mulatta]MOV75630.1 immunoglobulin light chain junction region [Macaca mulatta]MOV75784.1 immunoglobulin light chain junction region [Macaca mulatta]MOV76254.1 immunoglobulin light chain junction region [Macaca mulatta]
CQSYLTSPFTF